MRAKDLRSLARQTLEGNWVMSAVVAYIAGLLGGTVTLTVPGVSFEMNIDMDTAKKLFNEMPDFIITCLIIVGSVVTLFAIARMILCGPVQLGYAQYLLKRQDGIACQINELFSQFKRFKQGFLQGFLRGLYTLLWSLLFIIPGLVKAYSYSMTPFIMAENPELSAKEAIARSQIMMKGHKRELFWLEFSFIGWSFLCVFTMGIGFLFLKPYMETTTAVFYRHISQPAVIIEEEHFAIESSEETE